MNDEQPREAGEESGDDPLLEGPTVIRTMRLPIGLWDAIDAAAREQTIQPSVLARVWLLDRARRWQRDRERRESRTAGSG